MLLTREGVFFLLKLEFQKLIILLIMKRRIKGPKIA